MGVYASCLNYVKSKHEGKVNFGEKMLCGMIGGACGAVVGNPAEITLIRTSADNRLPPEQRRGTLTVFKQSIVSVKKKEWLCYGRELQQQ